MLTPSKWLLSKGISKMSQYEVSNLQTLTTSTLGVSLPELYSTSTTISSKSKKALERNFERLEKGEPLELITQKSDFYGLALQHSSGVLIPRPETEGLVSLVLEHISKLSLDGVSELDVLEVGVGSGCIACAILANTSSVRLNYIGLDPSQEAARLAKINLLQTTRTSPAAALHAASILPGTLPITDLTPCFKGTPLIVSNPPYIPTGEYLTLDKGVKDYEPRAALDGGKDGLNVYREIAHFVESYPSESRPALFLEIAPGIKNQVVNLLDNLYIRSGRITLLEDLFGRTRYLVAK